MLQMPNDSSVYKKIMNDLKIILNTEKLWSFFKSSLSAWFAENTRL